MLKRKILNKKEIKKIMYIIKHQWGCDCALDYAFLQSNKNKIYLINRDIEKIDLDKLRVDTIGLYFGEEIKGELKLSIEGSQLIGNQANKNILELNSEQIKQWMAGEDLHIDSGYSGFVLIKHNKDFIGTGKVRDSKLYNYVSKSRRISSLY